MTRISKIIFFTVMNANKPSEEQAVHKLDEIVLPEGCWQECIILKKIIALASHS
jgi:hypothetical protein